MKPHAELKIVLIGWIGALLIIGGVALWSVSLAMILAGVFFLIAAKMGSDMIAEHKKKNEEC